MTNNKRHREDLTAPPTELGSLLSRRAFLRESTLGAAALGSLLHGEAVAGTEGVEGVEVARGPHYTPRAKRVIYLYQSGGPSQLDLFDPKPGLEKYRGQNLPDSIRQGQRLTGMTAFQSKFPVAPSLFRFDRYGQSGATLSELLPHTSTIVDDLCFIRSMHTEQINHDPAITAALTGFQLAGRPSMGAWVAYGLGSENRDLPAFVVMVSIGSGNSGDQPLYDRLWGSGFLPSRYQGVKFHQGADPVLYLSNPPGIDRTQRRHFLDQLSALNEQNATAFGDPEILSRTAQYEMAFRMQASVLSLIHI